MAGAEPTAGPNLLQNGDFEQTLTGPWTVSENLAGSALASDVAHSGQTSLHLAAASGGNTKASAIWQEISPALTSGRQYSLSYWYLPGSGSNRLVLRLSSSTLGSTNDFLGGSMPAPLTIVGLHFETTSGLTVTWAAEPGGKYQLQATSDLSTPAWTDVGNAVDATSDAAAQTDLAVSDRQRFYRVTRIQ